MFGLQFLAEGLRSGEAVLVVLSSTSPEEYLESLAELGANVKEAIAGNRLKVVDWHSHQQETVAGVEERDHVLRCSADLTNVGIAVSRALAGLAPGVARRAVLEILSPALQAFEVGQVYSFAQSTRAKLARAKVTALFLLEKEMHSPATVSSASQPFDGVVDIDRRREGDAITRKIGVLSMKNTVPDETFHEFLLIAGRGLFIKPVGPAGPTPPHAGPTPAGPATEAPPQKASGASDPARMILRIAEERIRIDLKDADALFAKASALATLGDLHGAIAALDALVLVADTYPGLWVLRAKLFARMGDSDAARESRRKADEIQRREERKAGMGETVPCPLCEGAVPVDAHMCPSCGAQFVEEVGLMEELDSLGKIAIQERVREDLKVKPETGAPIDERPAPKPSEDRIVEPNITPSKEPAGRRGMTNGLARESLRAQAGRTNGLTNGLKGRTNGLTNGLKGRTNGLTNGLRGRTNGLTNGLRGRTNGLTNGLMGRTNGLTNGGQAGGRTNGLTNGLSSLRRGVTNGLTNGNGFTNGLGSARFHREARMNRWKLYVIPILAVALLFLPILGPASMRPEGPVIDGVFDDWTGVPGIALTPAAPDPDIDLTRVAFVNSTDSLSLLIEVRGQILAGGPDPPALMDALFVFVDLDRNDQTGYPVQGLGADRLLEIEGRGGAVYKAVAYRASQAIADRRDWRIWIDGANFDARASGNRIELAVDWVTLGVPTATPVFLVASRSHAGETDFADLHIGTQPGRVLAVQRHVAPGTIAGANVSLLSVNLTAVDIDASVSGVTVDLLGTAPPSSVNWTRLVDEAGATLANRTPTGRRVSLSFPAMTIPRGTTRDLTVSVSVSGSTGETLGARLASPMDVDAGAGVVTLRGIPALEPLGYIGQVPLAPAIDGGFAEWTNETLDSTREPETLGNPSIDISRFGVALGASDLRFHVRLMGPAFAGTVLTTRPLSQPSGPAPADRDRDGVPDAVDLYPDDFNNDGTPDALANGDVDGDGVRDYGYLNGTDEWLNTTIPATFPAPYAGRNVIVNIGPINLPPAIGEDELRLFVDVDNNSATGYYLKGIGADYLAEIRGREGLVADSSLSRFSGSSPSDWNWSRLSTVAVAVGDLQVEALANLTVLVPSPSMYVQVSAWTGAFDDFGIGTRGTGGTRSAIPFSGMDATFLPTNGGAFAFQATGSGLDVYAPASRGGDGDLTIRQGSLFLNWRTLGLGDPAAGLQMPGYSPARAAGPNLVFGGFEGAWEQYEVSENHVKHNVWLSSPPSAAGPTVDLAGELRIPDGASVLVDGTPWHGPFSAATELEILYAGSRVRLDPVFAYEPRRPDLRVSGSYSGDVQNGTVRLSMAVPSAWLLDPARGFPVVLDPSATGIVDTTGTITPLPSARTTFYDGTNFWTFYNDGSTMRYEPSSNGLDWISARNSAFTSSGVQRASVWYYDAGASKYVYSVGDPGNGKTVVVRKGTISGATITWAASDVSVTVSSQNTFKRPYIARDSNGYLWIVSPNKEGNGNYNFAAVKSTNPDDVSGWGGYTNLQTTGATTDWSQGLIAILGGGDLYAVWIADETFYGRLYTGGSWSGTTDTIATTSSSAYAKGPSALVDASFNIHLVYVDSSGAVQYKKRTSTWDVTPTTLDSGSGNKFAVITRDTGTGDLYAFWIPSTNQITAKKYSGGSWTLVTLETNTRPKYGLQSVYDVGTAANIAWTWVQGSGCTCDVKFSVLSTSLVSRTVDLDSSGFIFNYNYQRKIFYDGSTYYWAFYGDGTNTVYTYSADTLTWENPVSSAFTTTNLDFVSVWFHDTGTTKIVYAVADGSTSDTTVNVRRGTISGATISWGTEATVTVSATASTWKTSFITRSSDGYVWVASRNQPSASTYNIGAVRSANPDDVSSWGSFTNIADTSSTTGSIYGTILSMSGGNMYAFWYQDNNIYGKKYTGGWGSQQTVSTTATKVPSGVVDSSDNVHLAYVDGSGVEYIKRTASTSSWDASPTLLDSAAGSFSPTITIDTSNANLYAYWIASDNQIKGKQYSGSWSDITGIEAQTLTKYTLTSPYSFTGSVLLMWSQGSSPQEIKVEKIPEFGDIAAPIAIALICSLLFSWKRRRDQQSTRGTKGGEDLVALAYERVP